MAFFSNVGNILRHTASRRISFRESFAKYGYVNEARKIMDSDSGISRGFGFVPFNSAEDASSAIRGQELHSRHVRMNYSTERPLASGFGGGGGSYGGSSIGVASYGGGGNLRNESSKTKRIGLSQKITAALLLPLMITYKKVSSTFLLNLSLFWHINKGVEEIMADYVHQEMTRNLILIYLRLFLLIVTKDVFLSLVF